MVLTLVSLVLAVLCYTVSQLQQHGKLKWRDWKNNRGFWGGASDQRKYKPGTKEPAFFLSTTLLVFLTDGYHHMQFWFFNFLSLSITFALGFDWYLLAGVWGGIHVIHWAAYKFLQH